ncbi:MAG: aldo/keto reductase [Rhodospirillum sp.]|nr:aldo/keto reductase [Rhodospirillum sp.]MCF8490491.1 aldo/keto reductase [Rhodospirillum sp.]MCF8500097.1 aldo/keto reductase [Rhodospirillum sp.]
MDPRPLGRSGLSVSAFGMGTMTFGEQNTQDEATAILDLAADHGVTFLDAAELYPIPPKPETQGESERIIGQWMKDRGNRDRMVVATKVVGPTDATYFREGPIRLDAHNINFAVDRSLTNLGVEAIDLYYLHWPDRKVNNFGKLDYTHRPEEEAEGTPLEESIKALGALIKAGKIRAWGLSNETPWGVMRAIVLCDAMGVPRPAAIQNPYNLLNRTFEVGLAEVAHREDVPLVAYSPLAGGVLSGKYANGAKPEGARLTLYPQRYTRYTKPRVVPAAESYVALARELSVAPTALALAYALSRPFVASALVGATSVDQLTESLGGLTLTLSEETLAAIDGLHADNPNPAP